MKIGDYSVFPSLKKNKKYDVYNKENKYLLSFGDIRYHHYKDKIGYFKDLDHNDKNRRRNYRLRHRNDNINNPNYAGYWAWNYLW